MINCDVRTWHISAIVPYRSVRFAPATDTRTTTPCCRLTPLPPRCDPHDARPHAVVPNRGDAHRLRVLTARADADCARGLPETRSARRSCVTRAAPPLPATYAPLHDDDDASRARFTPTSRRRRNFEVVGAWEDGQLVAAAAEPLGGPEFRTNGVLGTLAQSVMRCFFTSSSPAAGLVLSAPDCSMRRPQA
jgi:hypothetical protein